MKQLSFAYLDAVIDESLERRAGLFSGLYAESLREYSRGIRQCEDDLDAPGRAVIDWRSIAKQLVDAVLEDLHRIGVRTAISMFRAQREEPGGLSYQGFHAWLSTDSGRAEVLAHYPELGRLLRLVVERHLRADREVLTALVADASVLRRDLAAGTRVIHLSPGQGDSHRGGRGVCVLRWDTDIRTVFKAQESSLYGPLSSVLDAVDGDRTLFGPVCPKSIVRSQYLWQEFVQHSDVCAQADEPAAGAAEYFRRFGRVSALLTIFGANDLHHENVIATADGPIVVDLETLVSLPDRAPSERYAEMARDVELSPLHTLLYPVRTIGGALDMDLSALGNIGNEPSERLRSFVIVDAGTDDIRFDTTAAEVAPDGANLATLAGTALDPRDWVDHITAGYAEGRERLCAHRDRLEDIATTSVWSVRQILRPTFIYWRFLEASTHPAYLGSAEDRRTLFRKMPAQHRGLDPSCGDVVCGAEVDALMELDIPFFEIDADSRDLRVNGTDQHIEDAVPMTARIALAERIAASFERPLSRDLSYIRFSLSASADDLWEPGVRRNRRKMIDGSLPPLSDTKEWHGILADLVVGQGAKATWMLPRLHGGGQRLDAANSLLYEGGGLLVYLAQATQQGCDGAAEIDIASIYQNAADAPLAADPYPAAASPFNGLLSGRIVGLEMARRGIEITDLPVATLPDDGLFDATTLTADSFDYINGLSGYLTYLATYADPDGPRVPAVTREDLLTRLVDVDGDASTHRGPLGLAHGRLGRIAALAVSAATTDVAGTGVRAHLEEFAEHYLRHRWRDASLADVDSSAGWCKGYSGVVCALAQTLGVIGYSSAEIRRELDAEISAVINAPISTDISLCHGVAGRIAVLCALSVRLADPALRDAAIALRDDFLDRYDDGGWDSGIGAAPDMPGFMLGLSGWHYARLLTSDPSISLPPVFSVALGDRNSIPWHHQPSIQSNGANGVC